MLTSCQELDTPINNIPTIETGEATEITATSALLSFKSENGKADCSLVYILSTSPDMNDVWESESNYIKDLIPNTTYYYMAALRSTTDGKNNEVRGEVKSFTTLSSIRLISVTSTSWDGSQEEYNPDMLGTYLFIQPLPPFIKDMEICTWRKTLSTENRLEASSRNLSCKYQLKNVRLLSLSKRKF